MSNPKIYGYCEAGCRRRVPSLEDFEKSASIVEVAPEKDRLSRAYYIFEKGKTYRLKNVNAVDKWGFTIFIYFQLFKTDPSTIELPAFDKYADGITFKWCGEEWQDSRTAVLVYELNGERRTMTHSYGDSNPDTNLSPIECISSNGTLYNYLGTAWTEQPTNVYLKNDGAEVLVRGIDGVNGKSAYEEAIAQGFEGTEAEWIASLQGKDGVNGIDGKSAYDLAKEDGFEGTEEEWLASLKGTNGAKGIDGINGRDGINGTNGTNGTSIYLCRGEFPSNGWYTTETLVSTYGRILQIGDEILDSAGYLWSIENIDLPRFYVNKRMQLKSEIDASNYYTKGEIDTLLGGIETVLIQLNEGGIV